MVRKLIKKGICFVCLFCFGVSAHFVYGASDNLSEIFKTPEAYDGKLVEITGEAIGEQLKSNDGVWINVSCYPEAIGVYSSDEQSFVSIKHWGAYGEKGDYVTVRGIFYKNFIFGGASAIRLNSFKITQEGGKIKANVSLLKQQLALILFAMCLFLGIVYFIKNKLWKRNLRT